MQRSNINLRQSRALFAMPPKKKLIWIRRPETVSNVSKAKEKMSFPSVLMINGESVSGLRMATQRMSPLRTIIEGSL
ncbi:hypothetical protein [Leptonema illini]|uniref:hypothetical protein n=1 Tax=Leptonema illini TaxID=183 RepID=UPI003CCBE738